jgi:hypothetical protein
MTNIRLQLSQHSTVHEFVAEAFNAATIALVGVLGILTVAATF